MGEVWRTVSVYITTENIALFSVIITIGIFVFTRRSELRYKKHDNKKVQYLKLIALLEQVMVEHNKNVSNLPQNNNKKSAQKGLSATDIELTDSVRKQFFDMGASLLIYGSKKLYRQYLFFRDFTFNPLIKQCKYYSDTISIYVMANILTTIRKEVGLSIFDNIKANEALGFFVNDLVHNPIAIKNADDAKFRIRMIKFELGLIHQIEFPFLYRAYIAFVKPIIGGVSVCIKFLVLLPLGSLLGKIFPRFAATVDSEKSQ